MEELEILLSGSSMAETDSRWGCQWPEKNVKFQHN